MEIVIRSMVAKESYGVSSYGDFPTMSIKTKMYFGDGVYKKIESDINFQIGDDIYIDGEDKPYLVKDIKKMVDGSLHVYTTIEEKIIDEDSKKKAEKELVKLALKNKDILQFFELLQIENPTDEQVLLILDIFQKINK